MAYYILRSYKPGVEPFRIFEALNSRERCFFLDSSLNGAPHGRYSLLGADPFYTLEAKSADPLPELRETLNKYKIPPGRGLPFWCGAVGFFSYDLGFVLEKKVRQRPKKENQLPYCSFGFYNTAVILDHARRSLYILSVGFPEKKYYLQKALCESNFKKIENLLAGISGRKKGFGRKAAGEPPAIESNFTKEGYIAAVKRAKEYIRKGDIYQVNLSQRFRARSDLGAPQIYERLRKISPSRFGAYMDCADYQILSSSPEAFLRLENGRVTTRPMKGTRRRSKSRFLDTRLKKDLLNSPKDKAELMMIVDLERNDLGRVCSYDSIRIGSLRQMETYSTVFQTTASVSGRLHKDKDRIDLIRACFPGGSITGCPKIRAMEIIEELEPYRRGVYTGCLGYFSFSGGMDFNILIRTLLKTKDGIYFSAGGGIVADSRPEDEYRETLVKAKGMLEAVK